MQISAATQDTGRIYDWLGAGIALAAAAVGLWIVERAVDNVMAFHAVLFTLAALAGAVLLVRGYNGTSDSFYSDNVVKAATIATVFWGIVGFLAGDILAWQLSFPALNLDLPWTNFGRLRPVHTSAVIFSFGGNALLATSFYVVQRTSKARMWGRYLPWFVFWGYQLFLIMAASGYVLGVTQGKEYAEPEWYSDLWLTAVWVAYLLVFVGTLW
ncbi:MAG TPA: cbb3-type cytochrome c oxidase subunit I, partial [Hyphomicrobiales bacterium]|nr:cbb3-type cytochrome c oxidase subunit I [Hyphomicrobiales bacterium]